MFTIGVVARQHECGFDYAGSTQTRIARQLFAEIRIDATVTVAAGANTAAIDQPRKEKTWKTSLW